MGGVVVAIFEVPINEQYTLKGYNWPVDSPKAFIVAIPAWMNMQKDMMIFARY